MSVVVHFLNGNDAAIEAHYSQKSYRNDIVVEIDAAFYEVCFFTPSALEYEMTKAGYFSIPGMIILDEISSEKFTLQF
jgi:hypothetical protein